MSGSSSDWFWPLPAVLNPRLPPETVSQAAKFTDACIKVSGIHLNDAAARSDAISVSQPFLPRCVMSHEIIASGDNFWNIRGAFRLGGVVDIGTHISLIRRQNGKFLFLDSYTLTDAQADQVDALTGGGKHVEAVLNLHPFHTVHVHAMHQRYPKAKLYWAKALAKQWKHAQNLCAAHTAVLAKDDAGGASIAQRILKALSNVSTTLKAHKRKYG